LGRSRGTFAAPTIVQNGDSVGRIAFVSYDGANYQYSAQIQCNVDGVPGIADTPGNLLIQTVPDGSSIPVTAVTISSAQVTTLAQPLPVGSGGLGITTTPINGQIPIGNGTNYTAATLTAGSGISITDGAGSVTIAATGVSATTEVTGTSATMVANNDYIANNVGLVTLTLPTTAALGSEIGVFYKGAGGWLVAQNAGQQISIGTSTSTSGRCGVMTFRSIRLLAGASGDGPR